MACLLVLSLSCVGLALVPTNAYWLLMVLRCVQAAGSASTTALGAGVIADITERAERGHFFGLYSLGPLVRATCVFRVFLSSAWQVGPCLGPVIGGALAEGLGWRCITQCDIPCHSNSDSLDFQVNLLVFMHRLVNLSRYHALVRDSRTALDGNVANLRPRILPETLRSLVGDGSIIPPPIYRPLLPIIGRKRIGTNDDVERPPKAKFQNPFRILFYPDVFILLFFTGFQNSLFYAMTASISTLFSVTYPYLSETTIGLCFLAMGGGMLVGSLVNGRVLDFEYRRARHNLERRAREDPEYDVPLEDVTKDEHFPIEYARFRTVPIYFVICIAVAIGYGWALQSKVNIAVPLILQVICKCSCRHPMAALWVSDVWHSRIRRHLYHEHRTDTPRRLGTWPGLFCQRMRTLLSISVQEPNR